MEQFASLHLDPNKLKTECPTNAALADYNSFVKNETERIRLQFIKASFEKESETCIENYFGLHLQILVKVADTVYDFQQVFKRKAKQRISNAAAIGKLYESTLLCLENLWLVIAGQFPKYFDRNLKMPDVYRWITVPEIERRLYYLKGCFQQVGIDEELINIVCQPMENMLSPEMNVSYHDLEYMNGFQKELTQLTKDGISAERIFETLLYLDFNKVQFFNYYIAQIRNHINEITDIPGRANFYAIQMKQINQLIILPGLIYNANKLSLREAIRAWLIEEMCLLEKTQEFAVVKLHPAPLVNGSEQKLMTLLSAPQISLFLKILIEAKVIGIKNNSELFKLVARYFRTDKQEHISEDSLRNKSNNFEPSTIRRVKDVIIGMMNLVRSY